MTISSVRERRQSRTLKRKSVRPLANLRKSFGGFSSEDGARVTAVYLTFIETCRLMKSKCPKFEVIANLEVESVVNTFAVIIHLKLSHYGNDRLRKRV